MEMVRKPKIPARRRVEKTVIWDSYREPVGFKFYGTYKDGKETKHFEFSVVVSRRMRRRVMYFWTRQTVKRMIKEKELPPKHYYHSYRGFMNLHASPWVETDGIVSYDVKHTAT